MYNQRLSQTQVKIRTMKNIKVYSKKDKKFTWLWWFVPVAFAATQALGFILSFCQ